MWIHGVAVQLEVCKKSWRWAGSAIQNAIRYWTMSIQNGPIASAIGRFDFAKSNSRIESLKILLSVALLTRTKS
jgi:hypothetical protein